MHFGKFSCTYCYKKISRRDDLHDHLTSCQKVISKDLQNFEQETSIILIPLVKNDVNENNEVSKELLSAQFN